MIPDTQKSDIQKLFTALEVIISGYFLKKEMTHCLLQKMLDFEFVLRIYWCCLVFEYYWLNLCSIGYNTSTFHIFQIFFENI